MKRIAQPPSVVSLILPVGLAVCLIGVAILGYQIYQLRRDHLWQQNEIMWFNSRINNVRQCLMQNDMACPDNKYVDSTPFIDAAGRS